MYPEELAGMLRLTRTHLNLLIFRARKQLTALGITDAATARLVTKRGSLNVLVEFDERMQPGTMSLPNGLGLNYPDHTGANEITGASTNELTDLEDRDKWVGTPWHKHVRARLEPIS